MSVFILEMQAYRLAAKELTPKLHQGRYSQEEQESCAHLGSPTQVIRTRRERIYSLWGHFNLHEGPWNGLLQEETVRPRGD